MKKMILNLSIARLSFNKMSIFLFLIPCLTLAQVKKNKNSKKDYGKDELVQKIIKNKDFIASCSNMYSIADLYKNGIYVLNEKGFEKVEKRNESGGYYHVVHNQFKLANIDSMSIEEFEEYLNNKQVKIEKDLDSLQMLLGVINSKELHIKKENSNESIKNENTKKYEKDMLFMEEFMKISKTKVNTHFQNAQLHIIALFNQFPQLNNGINFEYIIKNAIQLYAKKHRISKNVCAQGFEKEANDIIYLYANKIHNNYLYIPNKMDIMKEAHQSLVHHFFLISAEIYRKCENK